MSPNTVASTNVFVVAPAGVEAPVGDPIAGRLDRFFELSSQLETDPQGREDRAEWQALLRGQRDQLVAAGEKREGLFAEANDVLAQLRATENPRDRANGEVKKLNTRLAREFDKQRKLSGERDALLVGMANRSARIDSLSQEREAFASRALRWAAVIRPFDEAVAALERSRGLTRGVVLSGLEAEELLRAALQRVCAQGQAQSLIKSLEDAGDLARLGEVVVQAARAMAFENLPPEVARELSKQMERILRAHLSMHAPAPDRGWGGLLIGCVIASVLLYHLMLRVQPQCHGGLDERNAATINPLLSEGAFRLQIPPRAENPFPERDNLYIRCEKMDSQGELQYDAASTARVASFYAGGDPESAAGMTLHEALQCRVFQHAPPLPQGCIPYSLALSLLWGATVWVNACAYAWHKRTSAEKYAAARASGIAPGVLAQCASDPHLKSCLERVDQLQRSLVELSARLRVLPATGWDALPVPTIEDTSDPGSIRVALAQLRTQIEDLQADFVDAASRDSERFEDVGAADRLREVSRDLIALRDSLRRDSERVREHEATLRTLTAQLAEQQRSLADIEAERNASKQGFLARFQGLQQQIADHDQTLVDLRQRHQDERDSFEAQRARRAAERVRMQDARDAIFSDSDVLDALAPLMSIPAFERVQQRHVGVSADNLARRVEQGRFSNWAGETVNAQAPRASSYDSPVHLLKAVRDAHQAWLETSAGIAARATDLTVDHGRRIGVAWDPNLDGGALVGASRSRVSFVIDRTGRPLVDHIHPV